MTRYAEIALNMGAARGTYYYHIPPELEPLEAGHLVEVSFGTGLALGVVVAIREEAIAPHTKPILAILEPTPALTPRQIALSQWLAETTLARFGACLWLHLPPGLTRTGDRLYSLVHVEEAAHQEELIPRDLIEHTPGTYAEQVLALLTEKGPLRGAQIDHALGGREWKNAARSLVERGQLHIEPILNEPRVSARYARTVTLIASSAELDAALTSLRPGGRRRLLEALRTDRGPRGAKELMDATGADSGALKRLADAGLVEFGQADLWRDPLAGKEFVAVEPPTLTTAQAAAWESIRASIENGTGEAFLLNGVTGSGKTELYLRAIALAREQGRAAIALVPEIALVPQTVRRFMARFHDRVALIHSGLTPGQQYDTWRRVRAGQIDIVIGPRSALFMPFADIGVIVLDEEHDSSYKQSPPIPPPYYHAREVALRMGELHSATVILGSATPDVVTAWRAEHPEYRPIRLLSLPDRVMVHRERLVEQQHELDIPADRFIPEPGAKDALYAALPPVSVVDMRAELRKGNRSMFSSALEDALNETLTAGHQAILYLNRRGNASMVLCRDCGYIARCPRCDSPLTYHESEEHLTCHSCGFRAAPPQVCPECSGKRIRYFGAGTATLEQAVAEQFPAARVIRWDRDTTKERGAHEEILNAFAAGEANVLIGTQMIAKGLDIPRVTLVGVVSADTALGLPDYRAGERAFQLLTQVAGRAGRSWLGGRVIIQTYQPDHYAIRAAARHDNAAFYQQEIRNRRNLGYPPFKRLARLLFRSPSEARAQQDAEDAAQTIRETIRRDQLSATQVIGPAPAFFKKVNDIYRWQVLVKSTNPAAALRHVKQHPNVFVDVDPLDIL